jgi:hypothetical protein
MTMRRGSDARIGEWRRSKSPEEEEKEEERVLQRAG